MKVYVGQQRYQNLRKQLDSLHYNLPFSKFSDRFIFLDQQSTQLVEKLLQDLLQTTEGYQKMKNQLSLQKHDEGLNQ